MSTSKQLLADRITLFYRRFGFWILLLAFLSLGWVIPSALTVLATNRNDVSEWLPAGHHETVDLLWFIERFGSDEILVASWPGCTLEDPRLPLLVAELERASANSVHAKKTGKEASPPDSGGTLLGVATATAEEATLGVNLPEKIVAEELAVVTDRNGIVSEADIASEVSSAVVGSDDSSELRVPAKTDDTASLADQPLFKKIFHGPDVAAQLWEILAPADGPGSDEEAKQLEAEVHRRMSGWILGADGKTTCAVALISTAGEADRHAAVEAVYQAAVTVGVPLDELRVGGPTGDSVAMDQASTRSILDVEGLGTANETLLTLAKSPLIHAIILSIMLAWIALRRISLVLIVFGTAFYCELMSLAIMSLVGQTMNSVLIMVPTLTYVLSVSGSIHLINYYLDACRKGQHHSAVGVMFLDSIVPCFLASLTTTIGVGSLAMSDLVPIQKFGIFSAVSTMFSLAMLYVLLPAALTFLHSRKAPKAQLKMTPEQRMAQRHEWSRRAIRDWSHFVVRANVPIVLLGMMSLTLFGLGAMEVQTAVKLKSLFEPRAKVVQNYDWLEENLGPLVPVEIILRFPVDGASNAVERLQLTAEVQRRLAEIPGVGGALSTATFSPQIPDEKSARGVAARTRFKSIFEKRRAEIEATGYLTQKEGEDLWRISARVPAMTDEDYGDYLEQMRLAIEGALDSADFPAATEAQFKVSGGVPLFSSASKVLLSDLQSSFLSAFVLIGLSMFVLAFLAMRELWPGQGIAHWWELFWRASLGASLSMIPNVFPILLVFGVMGAFEIKVDIGAMMTASLALGIAVDDTLHFLTWFQRAMLHTSNRRRAVLAAFRHCALAMLQTSMVCSLGLLAFAPSEFIPISHFSWLMCATLLAALLGDMLILPALLASSLGSVFGGKNQVDQQPIPSR